MSLIKEELAIFGGESILPCGPRRRNIFNSNFFCELEDLLKNRVLSSFFGEHDVEKLENHFSDIISAPYSIAVNSGTAALHMALHAAKVKHGDEVIVNSISFVASASVILQMGAKPVFVDIEEKNLSIDIEDLKKKITANTKAVILVHLFGIPANVIEISDFCKKNNLFLIEDACQALGASIDNKYLGTFGDVGCFSFNAKKTIQSGEGGMLVCKDKNIAQVFKELRVNGFSPNSIERLGYNYTLTNLQAIVINHQLNCFTEIMYIQNLYGKQITSVIEKYAENFSEKRDSHQRSYYAIPFLIPSNINKRKTIAALESEGVPVGTYDVLYSHKKVFGDQYADRCAVAESIAPRLIFILCNHIFMQDDVKLMCKALEKVLSRLNALI